MRLPAVNLSVAGLLAVPDARAGIVKVTDVSVTESGVIGESVPMRTESTKVRLEPLRVTVLPMAP